ncbi:glycosyltransferase [Pseudoduganella chitinolytica]|uniref:Glycosyltransferase n=1 Tax=Pseudoduganella chitinolytica TaxID=34070 RepID=A0ABY8BDA3_9BURK|nr:glycosyltransferase [Pseudoduganella chitinolytica]WEF32344.1 glycosyltransferase [Pseudoduganella chitinolytica]
MAHFGVVAPAFYSHVNALAALAIELIERGHRVTFLHRPEAAGYLADDRIGFHAVGAATFPPGSLAAALRRAANPGSPWGLRRVIDDMAQTTAMLCRELPAALESLRIDAILGDQMEAAAGLVAEATGLPLVSVACALPVNREPGMPLPVMPFGWGEDERSLRMVEGSTRVYDWLMAPHRRVIEAQARRLGVPVRGMLHECLSPLAQISQTTASFDFPRRQAPAHFHHVGPLRHAPRAGTQHPPLPPVAADRPFVFASLGTLQGHRFGLFRRIAQACRQLDVQLLVAHCGGLTAQQALALQGAGATWVCAFAPQQEAVARADAVISHAGLNTVLDAIAARAPMLALPIAFDQPGAAARIRHAGIGLRASPRLASASGIARRLHRLLHEPAFGPRLDALATDLASAGGTPRAADIVESTLRLRPTQAATA